MVRSSTDGQYSDKPLGGGDGVGVGVGVGGGDGESPHQSPPQVPQVSLDEQYSPGLLQDAGATPQPS